MHIFDEPKSLRIESSGETVLRTIIYCRISDSLCEICVFSMDKAGKKSYLEKFCDVTERGDEFYVKFNRDVFYETLKKRHGKVLDAMKKHSLRSEHAEGIS